MKIKATNNQTLSVMIIGSNDFQRRLNTIVSKHPTVSNTAASSITQAWSQIISSRPDSLIIEVGINHSSRDQLILRELLSQTRERFGSSIYITVALMAPEKLFFGGDLLFLDNESYKPSGFIDTFISNPPAGFVSLPGIDAQLEQLLSLLAIEFNRRALGNPPTPALASDGWVHSLADPDSRELWMLWLPRYASYTEENPIITGPTGAGKTRLAKALHILSGRTGPFISITPRDFSSSELVQGELFGAVAGAYTGAVDKWGLVKSAENGTLFFDELQSIDKDLQGKLITFIENKSYRRVGSTETIQANVRFVFATNRSITEMVKSDTLRDDFAYRLERVQLNLAPLKDRKLDISAALAYSLAKIRRQRPMSKFIVGFTSQAYRLLFSFSWPGNLRQLENAVAKLCERADLAGENLVNDQIVRTTISQSIETPLLTKSEIYSAALNYLVSKGANADKFTNIDDAVIAFKEAIRVVALEACGGDASLAAQYISEPKNLLDLFIEARLAGGESDLN